MFIYKPQEDSYVTLNLLSRINGKFDICVDVGAGSCILTRALGRLCKRVVAVDINPYACAGCKEYDVLCAHGLSAISRADLVVSNPPYLPPEEPPVDLEAVAIYDYGLIHHILRWAFAYRPRLLVLTYSTLGRADAIEDAVSALGRIVDREVVHRFFEDIVAIAVEPLRPVSGSF
ncbi:MAG: methyltransferase domain-containing protein [Thermoproteus sp.]